MSWLADHNRRMLEMRSDPVVDAYDAGWDAFMSGEPEMPVPNQYKQHAVEYKNGWKDAEQDAKEQGMPGGYD